MAKRLKETQQKSLDTFRLRPLPACIRLAVAGGVLMGSVTPAQAELPIPASSWAAKDIATQQIIDNGSTLHIDQHVQNAVLNWDKFNVGAKNKVEFNQPNSSSIALNRIFQGAPSEILGKITANGQIYLYNQNGFVFGKDSVVNVNTLVASTLDISDEVLNNGLVQQASKAIDRASLGANNDGDRPVKAGSFVRVEKGAKISADGDANNDGLVILAAPTVENKGSISTNEFGQVILVASQDKVYLQAADNQSPFSGLLVEVETGGNVSNVGDILVRQGNITLEGFAVNQNGRLTATTSVNVNGSIRLLAQEKHSIESGNILATKTVRDTGKDRNSSVTFGSNSLTQIIGDTVTKDAAIDGKSQAQSYMEVVADKIQMKSGAAIIAPNANINMVATDDLTVIDRTKLDANKKRLFNVVLKNQNGASQTQGRILIENGAVIDVSGKHNVKVAMERNVGEVSVQTFDLRDSPFQKGGVLQGQTVRIDTRKDTKIVDTAGAVNSIQRTIDERLTKGGNINLSATGDVVLNSGAVVNISGGSIDYQDGYINTTKLLTNYGKIVDISDADPNEKYVSILGVYKEVHEKWGITKVWDNTALFGMRQFEKGYTQGQDAGKINIQAPLLSWNANLIAGSSAGAYQRDLADQPFGGSFIVNQDRTLETDLISVQDVIIQAEENNFALKNINTPFPTQADEVTPAPLVLSSSLFNGSGIQNVLVRTGGNIKINKTATLDKSGADITLDGGSVDVYGKVYSAGGEINLNTNTYGVDRGQSGEITLAKSALLDVSGRWINDYQLGFAAIPVDPLLIDGGSVNLTAVGDLKINTGSSIKADGGAHFSIDNTLTEGKGGHIGLAAVGYGSSDPSVLHLNGKLSAWGLSDGGSLNLTSAKIAVGSFATTPDSNGITPLVLSVTNGNFDKLANSGFSKINLESKFDNLKMSGDTHLTLLAKNRVLDGDFSQQASGKQLLKFSHVETLPEHLRNPVDLTLSALDDVVLATGSQIIADTGASVNLVSNNGGIYVDGKISAPAGSINLSINVVKDVSSPLYDPTQAIWLGSHSQLLAAGTTVMQPLDASNRRLGDVLDGGKVSLTANRGYVVQEEGSLIDVSGTQAVLDLPVVNGKSAVNSYQPMNVGSNAGSIAVASGEGVVLEGSIKGQAGSKTTNNGRFDLTLDPDIRDVTDDNTSFPNGPTVIKVAQHKEQVVSGKASYGDSLDDLSLNGVASVSSDFIENGGFGDVRLTDPDEIRFVGSVDLNAKARIELNTQKVGWESDADVKGNTVKLDTAYFKAGLDVNVTNTSFGDPLKKGVGKLTTNALWTELVGPTRWDSFKQINFKSTHDLRVRGVYDNTQLKYLGSLKTAANLNLNASQIYPSTLTEFSFTVDSKASPNGKINITGRNTDETPLSADGVLSFIAPNINQNGVLKAPFGTINLNAGTRLTLGGKSLTSVSADGKLIPFGNTLGGLFSIYPKFDEKRLVFNSESQDYRPIQSKQVNLTAPDIELAKGSKIDIAGGGDLLSYESIPNSAGGSDDYLSSTSPSYLGGFAIVPSLDSSLAPYDPLQQQDFAKLTAEQQAIYGVGNKVYLSGSDQLPAGNYTILPARYALLPGAFLVTPQANTQDQVLTTHNSADQSIVSGHFANAGTKTRDARSSGFLLESGDVVRKHSQYIEETANSFFVKQAILKETIVPLIPKDSGQIAIDVTDKLIIEGSINSTPMTDANGVGRGGKLDITTNNDIKIVDALNATDEPGTLEILAGGLNNLNLDSLFLGGTRSRDNATGQTNLLVKTANVEVDNGVNLKVKDLIIAAKNKVSIDDDAVLTASGEVNTGDTVLKVTNYGALLRVSGDQQISLSDESTRNSSQGELTIGAGAVINGITKGNASTLKSVLLDGSKNTQLAGDILMTGGSLSLYANAINLGELSNEMPGALNLSNQKLSNLSVDELQLNSSQAINFYGSVGQVGGDGQFLTEGGEVVPLHFGSLLIDAAGFSGFDNQGKSVRLQADSLILQNSTGAASVAGTGNGQLDILTNNYTQGAGRFAFNGFNTVNVKPLSLSEQASHFHIDGESVVTVAGDLNIKADYLIGTGGANLAINAAGHKVDFTNAGHVDKDVTSGFGASVSILADEIDFNTTALLYSGKLALHATQGDVMVGGQAKIDLSGKEVKFADVKQYTPGGVFSAEADQGKITLSANVNLNSGGGGAEGGRLILKAPKQTIDWSGIVTATSGSAVVDIKNFSPSMGFVDWMGILAQAGISESLYFRTRESDIVQGGDNTIKAKAVSLVADQGAINLSGTINTDGGAEGGAIELYAGDKITLQSGSVLTAKGEKGGKVLLSSVDSDKDEISGIAIQSGASIDVSGSTADKGGDVTLRALRDTGSVIKISPIAANTVKGAAHYYAEGVRKYDNTDIANGEINSTVIEKIKLDTHNYMTAEHIRQVSEQIDSKIQLRAGVEIDYKGNLTVKDKWDFQEWRYGDDIAGNLVMSATGKLTIANSISDAYKWGFNAFFNQVDILQGGNSWSYQLTAGADSSSADNFATINSAGHNLEIQGSKNAPVTVRTGIGDIKLAAGGDIVFKNQYATVYSAGKPTETQRYGVLGDYLTTTDYALLTDAEYAVDGGDLVFKADNNIQGAVSDQFISEWLVRVGDWGSSRPLNDAADSRIATAWGVNVNAFRQNVGLFGGGKVNINAGGNINNLSVMMPTTGKQIGTLAGGNNSSGAPKFKDNVVDVKGDGQLLVKAGGDIAGGAYFLGKGDGNISADGQVTGGKEFINGPQLVMGDATLALNAKQGVSLTAVSDAMMLSNLNQFYSYTQSSGISVKSLSGDVILGADTSVVRNKLGLLGNEDEAETIIYPSSVETTAFGGSVYVDQINLFPSTSSKLNILAKDSIKANTASESTLAKGFFLRDVDISLLPNYLSPVDPGFDHFIGPLTETRRFFTSSLPLLHRDDKEPVRLIAQDGDIQDIQAIFAKHAVVQAGRDLSNLSLDIQNIQGDDVTILSAGRDINYDVPLDDDFGFLIVNNATAPFLQISGPGDVMVKTGRNLDLGVSKGLLTVGGELNSNLDSKGANVTVLAGLNGNDLNYTGFISKYLEDYPLDNNFDAVSGLITTFIHERLGDDKITTSEALKLFKNLDLTEYTGIQGKLNALILPVYQNNSQLSYQGISNQEIIDSLKGNGKVSYDTLIDKYLQHFAVADQINSAYGVISGFMRERLGNKDLTDAQALALFKVLESDDYLSIQQQLNNAVLPVYFNEIKESGAASANDKASGNDRAYVAINTLFPGSELKTDDQKFPWAGNVNLTFSTIQTVEGGDINLLVPGGKVSAGLSFAFPGLEFDEETNEDGKKPSDLGIIAQKEGDINAVVRDDFTVNLSRVFTQVGGNITIWSTEGDIDAGRGAKTALSVPETVVTPSNYGKKSVIRPAVSGSGVRAAAPQDSLTGQGDVFLFAPGGIVNAGEAGIGGSNVTISATAVLGANNIQVGGVSTGVPTASVGSLAAGLSGVSNLSASVSQIAQAAADTSEKDKSDKSDKSAKLGVLSVDFIGYGDETNDTKNKNKSRPAS